MPGPSCKPQERCAPRFASATPQSWTTSCASTRFRGTRKARKGKAPNIPVMVLFALELVVLDTIRPLYVRGFAWVKLLKFWASSRYDDLQWLAPASMVLTAAGLHATLSRTKTSGPSKRSATLTATITSDAWLVSPRWLAEGLCHLEALRNRPGLSFALLLIYKGCAIATRAIMMRQRTPRLSTTSYAGRNFVPSEDGRRLPMRRCSARVQENFGRSIPNATVYEHGSCFGIWRGSTKAFGMLDDRLL